MATYRSRHTGMEYEVIGTYEDGMLCGVCWRDGKPQIVPLMPNDVWIVEPSPTLEFRHLVEVAVSCASILSMSGLSGAGSVLLEAARRTAPELVERCEQEQDND